MARRAFAVATVVALLLSLHPIGARADGLSDKIDPVLLQRMQADPTALRSGTRPLFGLARYQK